MKIDKLKLLTIIVCCFVFALWSEAQCMDPPPIKEDGPIKNHLTEIIPTGGMIPFAGEIAPDGWLLCDGQQYSNRIYPELFEVIKTKYVPDSKSWIIESNKSTVNEKLFCVPDLNKNIQTLFFKYIINTGNIDKRQDFLNSFSGNQVKIKKPFIRARLSNISSTERGYTMCSDSKSWQAWKAIMFTNFDGNESMKGNNLSYINIPEDGIYSISYGYEWCMYGSVHNASTFTGIAIDNPTNVTYRKLHYHQFPNDQKLGSCIIPLNEYKKDTKIILSIKEENYTQYNRREFWLEILKLN